MSYEYSNNETSHRAESLLVPYANLIDNPNGQAYGDNDELDTAGAACMRGVLSNYPEIMEMILAASGTLPPAVIAQFKTTAWDIAHANDLSPTPIIDSSDV